MHRHARFKAIQAGKNPNAIKAPEPEAVTGPLAYLFLHYQDLRGANARGFSSEPIPFSEIRAYTELLELDLDPFDVDTLRRLDVLWLKSLPAPQK